MIENNIEMIYDISAGRIREVDLTYTRQLKLAELREARINIRQDRV